MNRGEKKIDSVNIYGIKGLGEVFCLLILFCINIINGLEILDMVFLFKIR